MTEQRTDADGPRCRLCGTAVDESAGGPVRGASADGPFCSSGCRDVAAELGAGERDGVDADGDTVDPRDRAGVADAADDPITEPEDVTRSFFRIDGMHSPLCESYLETVAERRDGVADAAASYVTESVRVDHDPDRVSAADLEELLTTTGYTAYRREEATADSDDGAAADRTGGTRRSREMRGLRKRRTESVVEVRYIVGIVFGSFLLVPYVTVFYPTYLAEYSNYWLFDRYGEALSGFDAMLFLPLFFGVTGIVCYLTGMPLLRGAYVSLKLRRPSTQLLAALTIVAAYAYGTVAFVSGRPDIYYDLAILVAAVVMAAIFVEERSKRAAMNRLTDLTISQVGTARILEDDGTTREVAVADVSSDDRLLVRAGERIPVDGTLAEGACTVDEAVVTGESLPVPKAAGDPVIGGSVVTGDAAVVAPADETTSSIDRLTRSVWNLQSADHGVQRRTDALAAAFLPVVVAATVAVGLVSLLRGGSPLNAGTAALLTVIVVSPWAFGFATPWSVAASVRDAFERGIVVFDESVFERLRGVDVVVFDKTGTLTTGEMTVLEADAPADLLRAAGRLERRASHPAAAAIAAAFADGIEDGSNARSVDGGSNEPAVEDDSDEPATDNGPGDGPVRDFDRHATGVSGIVDGRRVLVGHPDLFRMRGWTLEDGLESRCVDARAAGHLPVLVGQDGRAEGIVAVGDEPRAEWAETVTALDESGVDVVVVTGDSDAATTRFREHPCVTHVFADVPPAGKTAAIRRLRAEGRVAMVGDGTNDAPALAAADLGVSLGGGTALAADAADLAIVEDDLAAVERAFALARAARTRVVRNLGLALGYNAIVAPVAAVGLLNPLISTAALAASTLLIVGSSSRSLLE